MGPIRRRHYEPFAIKTSPEITSSLELVVELTKLKLTRAIYLGPGSLGGLGPPVGYSDAFFNARTDNGLGFVLLEKRLSSAAGYNKIGMRGVEMFDAREHYSGVFELLAVFTFLFFFRARLRGRDLIMFVDNVGVLCWLVKGSAAPPDVAPMVGVVHLLLAKPRTRVYWEYVDSDSNPSDGISRLFAANPLSARMGWSPVAVQLPGWRRGMSASVETCKRLFADWSR